MNLTLILLSENDKIFIIKTKLVDKIVNFVTEIPEQ